MRVNPTLRMPQRMRHDGGGRSARNVKARIGMDTANTRFLRRQWFPIPTRFGQKPPRIATQQRGSSLLPIFLVANHLQIMSNPLGIRGLLSSVMVFRILR